ncbi:hypothetical protein V494_08128 [Pseudogymnoascus sp. VKM F-4513 (FW-928)]|nr:hypothetical protein V494_08128 [Pseudogymnoascus sp. VKM F-4513 (FW-928)]
MSTCIPVPIIRPRKNRICFFIVQNALRAIGSSYSFVSILIFFDPLFNSPVFPLIPNRAEPPQPDASVFAVPFACLASYSNVIIVGLTLGASTFWLELLRVTGFSSRSDFASWTQRNDPCDATDLAVPTAGYGAATQRIDMELDEMDGRIKSELDAASVIQRDVTDTDLRFATTNIKKQWNASLEEKGRDCRKGEEEEEDNNRRSWDGSYTH